MPSDLFPVTPEQVTYIYILFLNVGNNFIVIAVYSVFYIIAGQKKPHVHFGPLTFTCKARHLIKAHLLV